MSNFTKYRRKQVAELREVNQTDINEFELKGYMTFDGKRAISISQVDIEDNDSPKIGDMIARNPENHDDQWLVEKTYFANNFEEIPSLTKN